MIHQPLQVEAMENLAGTPIVEIQLVAAQKKLPRQMSRQEMRAMEALEDHLEEVALADILEDQAMVRLATTLRKMEEADSRVEEDRRHLPPHRRGLEVKLGR